MKNYIIAIIAVLSMMAAFLIDYLGKPVAPPTDMNPAYTKEGLTKAIQLAAQNAGISPKRIEIDDSEFPFLIGVVCKKGDSSKLADQIKQVADYKYDCPVSSSSDRYDFNVINITPKSVFPRKALSSDYFARRIYAREEILLANIYVADDHNYQ
jgi:hypothetical protein